ncbi:tryptophan--tRNA ligase [Patescibacteria group bacterium]|nr:tryptophan--tRNA ligase [Patescibacteria group bacterium]MBU2613538.1 tryptophan--tRNA ligase [Patescibacteria group bacterium]
MKDLVFSGIQPTSDLHLGNYLGALKQWVAIQHDHPCLFCIVDLHAITVAQDPKMLRQNILGVAATYLAAGIDPKRSHIYVQSEVPQHAELAWILGTITKLGELERMTQFKDKSGKQGERVGLGLFSYPVLMAADILLYGSTAVPVGQDQMQHLELARVIARRFNERFGDTFAIPQALIQKIGNRIMSLQDPAKKMSKSDPMEGAKILLRDDAETIRKKIMRAVTDSGKGISYDPEKKPAVSNLMTLYHHASGKTMKEIEKEFAGAGYGDFKKAVADAVIGMLGPMQKRMLEFRKNPAELKRILDAGRDAATEQAEKMMRTVRTRVGLGRE